MPKTATEASGQEAPQDNAMQVTLQEFCIRLSANLNRTELIGAFEFSERRAGRLKDSVAAFQARFDAFVNTPV